MVHARLKINEDLVALPVLIKNPKTVHKPRLFIFSIDSNPYRIWFIDLIRKL